jgi:hypothetical protein
MNNRDDELQQSDPSALGGGQASASPSIPAGATIYDVSGEKLGKVGAGIALGDYFRLEKGLLFPHEYYVPKSAISLIDAEGVHLNVTKEEMKNSGWENPPLERRVTFGEHVPDSADPNEASEEP